VAGHTLSAEEAPPVVAWLEGWWGEEEEEKEKAPGGWPGRPGGQRRRPPRHRTPPLVCGRPGGCCCGWMWRWRWCRRGRRPLGVRPGLRCRQRSQSPGCLGRGRGRVPPLAHPVPARHRLPRSSPAGDGEACFAPSRCIHYPELGGGAPAGAGPSLPGRPPPPGGPGRGQRGRGGRLGRTW
jgi:hypothetical protein